MAKGKDVRVRVILECTSCVRNSVGCKRCESACPKDFLSAMFI